MNNMPLHHNQFDIISSKHYLTLLIILSTTVIIIAVIMYLVLNLAPLDLLYMMQGATKENYLASIECVFNGYEFIRSEYGH